MCLPSLHNMSSFPDKPSHPASILILFLRRIPTSIDWYQRVLETRIIKIHFLSCFCSFWELFSNVTDFKILRTPFPIVQPSSDTPWPGLLKEKHKIYVYNTVLAKFSFLYRMSQIGSFRNNRITELPRSS